MDIGKTLLSRYKIVKKLGRGGFGCTYLANDTALPGNPHCVVKHLSPQNPNPKVFPIAKKLFDREARSLYRLGQHDRIPRLYAHFCQEEQFYLVQELIEGSDLSEEIKPDRKFSEEETTKLLREILEILSVIHKENIIHRDIKPSNIMRRKEDDKLVLIDFGLVKDLSASMDKKGSNTVKVGSNGYMPPEQSFGQPKLSSDVYAVGILAIQALTGIKAKELPKDYKNREIEWRELVKVSDGLADVLDKMVSYDYNARYQDASEALKDLITKLKLPNASPNTSSEDKIKQNKTKLPWIIVTVIAGLSVAGITGKFLLFPSYDSQLAQLKNYLEAEEWNRADKETDRVMLRAARNDLDIESLSNFSCKELQEIDTFWREYSGDLFGFSIQKNIYLEAGHELDEYSEEIYDRFSNTIHQGGIEGDNTIENNSVHRGYFPTLATVYSQDRALHSLAHWRILSRAEACGL